MLPQGTEVMITQSLGGSYTVMVPSYGGLFRLSDRDADAIGKERPAEAAAKANESGQPLSGEELESRVWQSLKTCYDPEIPVNIVDLGLIYDMHIDQLSDGARIDVKMTLTAPGCPVAGSLPPSVESRIEQIPEVSSAKVELVWDPQWGREMMSEVARLELGM